MQVFQAKTLVATFGGTGRLEAARRWVSSAPGTAGTLFLQETGVHSLFSFRPCLVWLARSLASPPRSPAARPPAHRQQHSPATVSSEPKPKSSRCRLSPPMLAAGGRPRRRGGAAGLLPFSPSLLVLSLLLLLCGTGAEARVLHSTSGSASLSKVHEWRAVGPPLCHAAVALHAASCISLPRAGASLLNTLSSPGPEQVHDQ